MIVVREDRLPEAILFVAVPPAEPAKTRAALLAGVLVKFELQFPEPPFHVEIELAV